MFRAVVIVDLNVDERKNNHWQVQENNYDKHKWQYTRKAIDD